MQNPPASANPLASQETLLLDYLHKLERHRHDRRAAHVHLSMLHATNRRDHHLRIAVASFDDLVKMLNAQLFMLTNKDLIIIYRAQVQDDMEAAIVKLRYLFSDDPILADESYANTFCTWYSLDREFEQILALAQQLVQEEEARQRAIRERAARDARQTQPKGSPFTPELLARTEAALAQADLANLLRRQPICAVTGTGAPQPVFHEVFVSIADLRQTLMPSVNMTSSPWLFQELTETLDRRVLSLLNKHDDRTLEGDISLNLNVATLLSPEFLVFDDNVKVGKRGTIVIELQKVDIFADLSAYLFARDFAHDRGYRICIDGLSYAMLPFVDRERLGADLIKLVWDSGLVEEASKSPGFLRRIGVSRIILCRCDTPSSIEFGQSVGISLFQGRHIDSLFQDVRHRGISRTARR